MIMVAVQRGNFVYVYDDKHRQIAGAYGELVGFTSTTFSVRRCNYVYSYFAKGAYLGADYMGGK